MGIYSGPSDVHLMQWSVFKHLAVIVNYVIRNCSEAELLKIEKQLKVYDF